MLKGEVLTGKGGGERVAAHGELADEHRVILERYAAQMVSGLRVLGTTGKEEWGEEFIQRAAHVCWWRHDAGTGMMRA